ncbi:precorrin-3B synthase [Fuscovulum ytuae]|uniref:Precorrin-3B synthase n=1 Tax=Fuscovulum ytuae TaxID=3042299 RepID=A0ABY8Q1Q0_9RHOB|nr:precorrin-3B synthase [Fuscovulum sp. YMD61]WGV14653.1 precorrin-3B synthase [Fuscovulum sp. YMD61]
MTPAFTVKGWCPGALRPMASGDGLVVRVRPTNGRLTAAQAAGLAQAAARHGNGLIDLSARGNVQLRGVTEGTHAALIDDLRALGLIDPDILSETRRNILVTPFADGETDALAATLAVALADVPPLPGKFGFVIDTGPAPILTATAGDIRLERGHDGGLILRPDGLPHGIPVTTETAAAEAIALARWFTETGGITDGRGRMAAHIARGHRPALPRTATPAPAQTPPGPGLVPQGALVAFEFGQMTATTLSGLAALGNLRITPWRMVLIEGLQTLPTLPGLILSQDDPLRRVEACTGAPGCLQAHAEIRPLARRLAAQVPPGRTLHLSGCAKGCAHPGPADLTLVATPSGFDLIQGGTAQDAPRARALDATGIDLKGLF